MNIYGLKSQCQYAVLDLGDYGRFHIAPAEGSTKFAKVTEEVSRPYRALIKHDALDENRANQILAEIFARCVVVNWEGVVGEDNQPIPYSQQKCKELLLEIPNLFTIIREFSRDTSNFRNVQADVGNSATS
jgi:hypothetical protein